MALQKVRSDAEAIETTYTSLMMQLKLVLGYLKDEEPDAELARRFLGEAKKMTSELRGLIEGQKGDFIKIDRKLGTDIAKKAGQLHEFLTSTSVDPSNGVIKVLDAIEERIIGNDTAKAVEHLEALRVSLEQKEPIASMAQGINWGALSNDDLAATAPDDTRTGKEGSEKDSRKIVLIYSASPENDYLVKGLVGKFLKKNDIEPIYMVEETIPGWDELLEGSDAIFEFITKDVVWSEKRFPKVPEDKRKLVVYVESGAEVPQEIKNRYELQYFSRDRTGELLIQIMEHI